MVGMQSLSPPNSNAAACWYIEFTDWPGQWILPVINIYYLLIWVWNYEVAAVSYNLICYSLYSVTLSYPIYSSAPAKVSHQGVILPSYNPNSILTLARYKKNHCQVALTYLTANSI